MDIIIFASTTPAVDYSTLTSGLGPLALAVVGGAAAVIAAALTWKGVSWGFPKLMGLFNKTAK